MGIYAYIYILVLQLLLTTTAIFIIILLLWLLLLLFFVLFCFIVNGENDPIIDAAYFKYSQCLKATRLCSSN